MLTERENMEICWNHEEPEWVPMINTASQMIITPEINDRPLFMDGADWSGLEWELDKENPLLMTHVKPGGERFDDITRWQEFLSSRITAERLIGLPWAHAQKQCGPRRTSCRAIMLVTLALLKESAPKWVM